MQQGRGGGSARICGFVTDTLAAIVYHPRTMIEFLLHAAVTIPPAYRKQDEYARHVVAPISTDFLYQRAMSATIRHFNNACKEAIEHNDIAKEQEHPTVK